MMINENLYLVFKKCPKSFWLHLNNPSIIEDKSIMRKHYNHMEKEIFDFAKEIIPNGSDANGSLEETQELLDSGETIIYNAQFNFENLIATVPIMKKLKAGWEIIWVTREDSSPIHNFINKNKQEAQYLRSARSLNFIKYLLSKLDMKVIKSSVIAVNRFYKRGDSLDLKKLLDYLDITSGVNILKSEINKDVTQMTNILAESEEPEAYISNARCKRPQFHECQFIKYCWKGVPDKNIFSTPKLGGSKLNSVIDKQKLSLESVREDAFSKSKKETAIKGLIEFTEPQKTALKRALRGTTSENIPRLKFFMDELIYPLYHWDVETFAPVVPPFKGVSPYDDIPFQYSLHIQQEDDSCEHFEFIKAGGEDPRKELIEKLIKDMEGDGSVIVYNMAFESRILTKLAEQFPEYEKELNSIKNRIVDLLDPFRDNYYYHPDMMFSNALKSVYKALIGNKYSELNIQEGLSAMAAYFTILFNPETEEQLVQDLLNYCHQDTYAMVEIIIYLNKVLKNSNI